MSAEKDKNQSNDYVKATGRLLHDLDGIKKCSDGLGKPDILYLLDMAITDFERTCAEIINTDNIQNNISEIHDQVCEIE